jgi:hypothetical protein
MVTTGMAKTKNHIVARGSATKKKTVGSEPMEQEIANDEIEVVAVETERLPEYTPVPLTPIVKKIIPEFGVSNTTALTVKKNDGAAEKNGGKKSGESR